MIWFRGAKNVLTLAPACLKRGRFVGEQDLGQEPRWDILALGQKILWMGPAGKIPKHYRKRIQKEVWLKGKTVFPGLVESHTHLVFAGNRAAEFEERNQGVSYFEIANRGGGILRTLQETRKATGGQLSGTAQERVRQFVKQGVTTLEIKSGYGLDAESELKILKVIGSLRGPLIVPTFLGAHAIPPEYLKKQNSEEAYLKYLIREILPKVQKSSLSRRVDIFVEKGFFSEKGARKYLSTAKAMGFDLVVHADQLTLCGGARLAVEVEARSADHLIQVTQKEIAALAGSEVTAVLLPSADLYMKCPYPPARHMIDQGVRVALATDFNPGSSPSQDVGLVGLLARTQMGMSLPEVIAAYTIGASYALGLENQVGSLEVGKRADFFVSDGDWQEAFFTVGTLLAESVYLGARKFS